MSNAANTAAQTETETLARAYAGHQLALALGCGQHDQPVWPSRPRFTRMDYARQHAPCATRHQLAAYTWCSSQVLLGVLGELVPADAFEPEHACPECGAPMVPSKFSPEFCTWYVCDAQDCDA